MRVMVVEDEALVAMAIEDELLDQGWDVVRVGTAAAAMRALLTSTFDAAVVDLGLPDMRGGDLIRWMRSSAPHVAVVVCSGYGGDDPAVLTGDGDVSRVGKPWVQGDVARTVSAAMCRASVPAL